MLPSRCSGSGRQFELLTPGQHRPGHACVLGRNGHHRLPIPAALGHRHGPATQAVLLALCRVEHRARTHHQQAAQLRVSRLGDAPQARLSSRAVLAWHQPDPGSELAPACELAGVADHRHDRRGGGLADAHQLHELLRGVAIARHGANMDVVLFDPLIQMRDLAERVADHQVGKAGQILKVIARLSPHHLGFEWQHDVELAEQATDAVDAGRAFDHETLPGTVHHQPGLLVLALDRHEAHVRALHRLAGRRPLQGAPGTPCRLFARHDQFSGLFVSGLSVGGVVFAALAALGAHAVRRDQFGRHQLARVVVGLKQPGPVMCT